MATEVKENSQNTQMDKNTSNKKPAICGGCQKELYPLPILSPVINDELWDQCLSYYSLSENRPGPQLSAMTPQYICAECMEKALGRKLILKDLKAVPFNVYFNLYYFHNVSFDTVVNIRNHAKQYINKAPQFKTPGLQTEINFIAGVAMPFLHSDLAGYAKSLLALLSDDELTEELKRRDKERQAMYPKGVHCRDCKYCGEGFTWKHQLNKTMVCFVKPKLHMGQNCYYATTLSHKACEKFESK